MSPMPDPDAPLFQLNVPPATRSRPGAGLGSALRVILIMIGRVTIGAGAAALILGALWAAWFLVNILSRALGIQ